MKESRLVIDTPLVHRLISSQFPKWKDLPIEPVQVSGWDNRTFHLGRDMLVRLPSAADYELQVEKEHQWLPKLALSLPFAIPTPLAMGKPENEYPWKWSIYRWIEGESAASMPIKDLTELAEDLAKFFIAFHKIDTSKGPKPGLHSFYRGGALSVYDDDARRAIDFLKDQIDTAIATKIWEKAISTVWQKPPVWVHGDISVGNVLLQAGKLSAIIDFGQLAVGDPACDLSISWTLFHGESRDIFQSLLSLDQDTWARARGWTLWKALMVAANFSDPNNTESRQCWRIIEELFKDHQRVV